MIVLFMWFDFIESGMTFEFIFIFSFSFTFTFLAPLKTLLWKKFPPSFISFFY